MRPFIKVRLSDTKDAHEAYNMLEKWKRVRSLSQHLPRAILLYAGLLKGNDKLLGEYFPFVLNRPTAEPLPDIFPFDPPAPRAVRLRHVDVPQSAPVVDDEADLDSAAGKFLDMFG